MITEIPGITVGHWTNLDAGTGCTVVLCPEGACAGVDVRGSAPGTRETDLLDPLCMVEEVHAVLLGGGSAYGLAAADGVMRWLEEHGFGLDVGVARVPIVPAAILFDLPLGRPDVRPDAAAGYAACAAASDGPVAEGSVGAGTGAAVGKIMGFQRAVKGGLGVAGRRLSSGVIVSALVAVNPFGGVVDPATGAVLAGPRQDDGSFADTVACGERLLGQTLQEMAGTNTTLAVVATDARLDKAGCRKVAQMAQDGYARAIRPAHTRLDGDTIFALSRGDKPGDAGLIGAVAADLVAEAIVRAVEAATSLHGIPAIRDLRGAA
ncbi:MAG: P1 family peptidase [Caldilineaceae bacterium]|nr:P1 family peptidase [Caldilineaceae bacterium]